MLIPTYHQFPHSSSIWWLAYQVAIAGMAILTRLNSLQ
ncbi:hypothetical protein COO91_08691 [Nostoc flagelliforme CCNUN1]|uniref:Uncharacterized protein n=1 Tax=Nostoc flagelliforme CCNUN1 TaxID=2038116 RepID=A0A2K8T4G0_9NOSO|nr:hypothetical protein COO91_08691 [Nostoc flagelliforme CCNUN1]